MKLTDVLALVKPFLAVDAKPDEIKAAILAADKAAKDKAKDENTDPERTNDEFPEKKEAKDKKAKDKDMDADDEDVDAEDNELSQAESGTPSKSGANKKPAIDSAEVDRRIKAAVAARDELHVATREVEPIVGQRTFDSAGAAYKAGLEALGVDLEGVPEPAYRAVLKLAKDRAPAPAPIAMDSANEAEVLKLIPNYNRL
jgi:hypothetical protein